MMIYSPNALILAVCILAVTATSAMARESRKTVCLHDNQTRIVEIVYSGEDNVPCEVQYTKAGGMKVLWRAQHKVGYCENQAAAFVEKQIDWGWSCDLVDDDPKAETTQ